MGVSRDTVNRRWGFSNHHVGSPSELGNMADTSLSQPTGDSCAVAWADGEVTEVVYVSHVDGCNLQKHSYFPTHSKVSGNPFRTHGLSGVSPTGGPFVRCHLDSILRSITVPKSFNLKVCDGSAMMDSMDRQAEYWQSESER